jgi:hypothetical protein
MSFDLMYDVEDFKLASKGWHLVKVKEATIKAADKAKNPESPNDKNFVVTFVVTEDSDDNGAEITKYFAHIVKNDFTLKQLGAMLVCAGVITPDKITGSEFFDSKGFETNFQMKLPEKLLGVFVDHRAGDKLKEDGTKMYFADIKKYRTTKDTMAEMKKNGGGKANVESTQNPKPTNTGTISTAAVPSATPAPDGAWD